MNLYGQLNEAEKMSTAQTKIIVQWEKIMDKGNPSYRRYYGPQFLLQISGSRLIAPSRMFFTQNFLNYTLEILQRNVS